VCFEQLGYIEVFDISNNYNKVYEFHHPTKEWIIDACETGNLDEFLIAIYERGLEFVQLEKTNMDGLKIKDGFQTTYFSFQKIHCICKVKKNHFLVAISG
jgi:hypothetical protein